MDYFRQELLSYRLDRQMSTLLHIHVECDRPKELIHFSKTKNYVDQIINEYSVPMCSYPQLNTQDCRLSYNIFAHKKSGTNIFQLQEVKRKIAKPKNSKRDRICPCCQMKCYFRHKCEHTVCQKPCKKMKSSTDPQDDSQKKKQQQEEEFTLNRQQLENEDSPSSKSQDLSQFSEEMEEDEEDEEAQISLQQSLSKQVKKVKKGGIRKDTRGRKGWKGGRFRGKGPHISNRGTREINQDPSFFKKQSRVSDNIDTLVKKETEQPLNIIPSEKQNDREINRLGLGEVRRIMEIGKRKGKGKRSLKNIDKDSQKQSEIEIFELSNRRRLNPLPQNKQETEQQISKQQEGDIPEFVFNSKQALSYFVTPEQINSNEWFEYRITDENAGRKGRKPGTKPNIVKVDMRRTQNKIKALNMEKEQKQDNEQRQTKQRRQIKQRKQVKQKRQIKQTKQRNFGRKKKKVNEDKKMEVEPPIPQLEQLGMPQNEPQLPKKQINLSMISVIADLNLEKSKPFQPQSQVLAQPQMNNNIKSSMENQEILEPAVNVSFDPIISPLDEQEAAELFGNSDDPQQ